ncbi:hypothetical protein MNEG_10061 [Monoraphidium neglectum]|uniref:MARVEL domain-containing protein n=1 Tax=Monoraphidium neglectum TaxID=145388 RepID=A0A0D2JEA1_9CHLO|nr:hypothetical protein MNEG_10061 [Monoraphidium neglectum]KIY97902.1 hypothetical protein MNEG_10061 [Monoraphidium neglectum]|eukprot:XP_013896922.1 hypothetical protein MNEG_10061 [Monoraphidium neglectum]
MGGRHSAPQAAPAAPAPTTAAPGAPPAAPPPNVPPPTVGYIILTEILFALSVGLPIGMLAIVDQHLTSKPFTYTGTELPAAYQNRTFNIELVGDFNFTAVGFLWWLAMAIVFSVWANASNTAGNDGYNWRNVYCFFAWVLVIAFGVSSILALIMLSERLQRRAFGPRPPKKKKERKPKHDKLPVTKPNNHHPAAPAAAGAGTGAGASAGAAATASHATVPANGAPAAAAPSGGAWPQTGAGRAASPAGAGPGAVAGHMKCILC